jgi:hypothetical protein
VLYLSLCISSIGLYPHKLLWNKISQDLSQLASKRNRIQRSPIQLNQPKC